MRGQKLGFVPVVGHAARREHWGGASEDELGRRWMASGDAGRDGGEGVPARRREATAGSGAASKSGVAGGSGDN